MSCSSPTTSAPSEADLDDPLCITESDRRQFSESGAMKRKAGSEDESADSKKRNIEESEEIKKELDADGDAEAPEIKLEQEEEQSETKSETAELEPKSEEAKFEPKTEEVELELKSDEEQTNEQSSCKADASESPEEDFDVAEKLKTMDEISVQPVNKSEKEQIDNQDDDSSDKVSIEITKKDKKEDRKVTNLRKNIKDVIDDTQLDATTLAAQRQESERLARVQEQQRLIREAQRQMAAEKQSNKTQQKVLSILQGSSPEPPSLALSSLDISSSLSITPTAKTSLQSLQSLISTCDDDDSDDDVVIQPDEPKDKSAVVVDSSSDSDDCIILSDEEEEDVEEEDENNSGEHTNDLYNQRDSEGRVVVNIGHDEKEENIYVAPQIARIIKHHQIGGVRFLFDNIIESVELFDKSSGFGCILAHSMGLGKTLQLVCFCDIFLRHTNSKSILVIMPINTLQNWLHEFNMWLPLPADVEKSPLLKDGEVRPRQFNIFVLNDSQKTLTARARTVLQWSKEGGVLMMGYEMYRLLSLKKQKKKRGSFPGAEKAASASEVKLFDDIHSALVNPGPDLIVCDEGHRIKNAHASTSVALKQIRSKRRIVLTGYPLQNNLLEYWCMVDFVRPSYLGTKTEFSNMFERPIQNGQCIDSTPIDCKLMRHRAHVLHSLLKGFVQRRSQMVLQKCLPEKREFVLLIRMTPFQRKLYSVFMDEVVRSKKVPNPLKAFAVCCKIWNHPDVLYNFLKKRELDLDIELEEAEAITSGKSNPAAQGPKKRGRKTNESKGIKKEEKKGATEDDKDLKKEEPDDLKPVKLEATASQKATPAATGESFKTSQLPLSNGSAYSSNQSMSSNFDSSSSSFNSYSGYPNYDSSSYQNYNNYNNNGNYGYQNWQGQNNGNNYWQNNFYQPDFPQQNYYPQQSQQQQQPSSYQPPYYANSNYQSFEQKPSVLPKVDSADAKSEVPVRDIKKLDGGLLADEIKEEAKELQDKSSKDKDDSDTKDPIAIKSSRDDGIPYDWAVDLMKDYVADLLETSPKMEIFFCILEESITVGDRLLVFSQSLLTLNIMERFLQKSKTAGMDANWARNVNYFRLDGSTAALEREKLINEFNSNTSVKLFLVSTRAGSLGINLVGANRVIVFDASWNPCHDTQAVCRVYRYGQAKSCFVYRFVMDNCLEKKIYDRQINKQGMADRVVDECNPDAHLSMREVTSLCYDDGEDPELKDFGSEVDKYDDLAMKKILESHSNTLTKEPFQHDSLLVDRKEMKLSQAEKRIAQRNYEKDKQAASKPASFYGAPGSNYRVFRTTDGSLIHRPVGSVRPVHNEIPSTVMNTVRPNPPRPTRWVPVEVWQSKGLTAQEMTLPQDVSIQTNAADKSKIYLKAGQKVIVLKSPKGICLQLESGKVIAIRASVNKNGPQIPGSAEQKIGGFMQEAQNRQNFPVGGSVSDVIDISNDDDDDDDVKANVPTASEPSVPLKVDSMVPIPQEISNGPSFPKPVEPNSDPVYKDKVVYKPNLVPRKPKLHPSTIPPQDNRSQKPFERMDYQPRMNQPPPNKWESYPNPVHQLPPPSQVFNGGYKNSLEPYRSSTDVPQHAHSYRDQPTDPSAFHQPGGLPNPYPPPVYPPQNVYQNAPYQAPSYPPAQQNNFGYPYHNASYPNAPSYQYSPQTPQNYDQNYPPYQGINYNNQISSTNTIPTDQSSH